MIRDKIFIKVSEELARKIGFYIVKSENYYVSITNYITYLLPKPFTFVEDFTTERGISIRVKSSSILDTVEVLLGISKEIHIYGNEVVFIVANDSLCLNLI